MFDALAAVDVVAGEPDGFDEGAEADGAAEVIVEVGNNFEVADFNVCGKSSWNLFFRKASAGAVAVGAH